MSRLLLVTRTPRDCTKLAELVKRCGYSIKPYPVLRIGDELDERGWVHLEVVQASQKPRPWLLLSSPRAPRRFVDQAAHHRRRDLLELPVAAVGPATAKAGREAGLRVDLVGPGTGAGLAAQLTEQIEEPATFVFACGRHRRTELPTLLERSGHTVIPVVLYRMTPTPSRELPPLDRRIDAVLLTSPRSARYYLEGVGGHPLPCVHWALGPTTRDAARQMGIECRIPKSPNLETFAEELCQT